MSIKTAIAKAASAVGTFLINTAAQIGAANGGFRARLDLSGPPHDGRIGRRNRPKQCTRAVDCVVMEQWLMWRH